MLVSQGAGAVSGAAGAFYSAHSQKLGYKLDAYFNELNADIERDNARHALADAQFAETKYRLDQGHLKARQIAAMGANNVDMTTGSALDRLVTTDYITEVDAKTIRLNAAREAAGHRMKAVGHKNQATMSRAAAKGINPLLSGAASLLGSAGKIYSDWYTMNKMSGSTQGGASGSGGASYPSSYYGWGSGTN